MITLCKKHGMLKAALILSALLTLLTIAPSPVKAVDAPPSPWQTEWLYGTVTINGAAAPAGTAIAVYVAGTLSASTTVDSLGRYGYTPQFYITGNNGQAITFQIGTVSAAETALFLGGTSTRINLSSSTTSLFVSTSAATNLGSSSATMNGILSDMGGNASVTVSFQYGTTISYGATSTTTVLSAIGSFSIPVTGLTANTTYHCKAVATGSVTVSGNDVVFTTTQPNLSVSTNAATGPSATGATLNGNLNDMGSNTTVNVYFQYGLTSGYGSTTATVARTATGAFSTAVTGLSGNQTYHFRAVAQGATTVYGTDMTFVTPPGTLSVTTGIADMLACNSARLNGNLTDLGLNSSASVNFQWGLTTAYSFSTPIVVRSSTGAFTASISGLLGSTTYHFKAVANGSSSVPGIDGTFTTPACGTSTQTTPNQFYGRAYINSAPAPQGTTIIASVGGVQAGSTTADAAGRYGYSQLFYLNGNNGDAVTFTVGNYTVPQRATWTSGAVTNLDLFVSYDSLAVSTGSFSYLNTTSENLGGTLTGMGTDTSAIVSIEYGLTTSYSSSTSSSTLTAPGAFTCTATGLTLGATYHYRAKAIGSLGGTVYGNDATFVFSNTLSVSTNNASSIPPSSAVINGYLNSLGSDTSSSLSFYWGTTNLPATPVTASPSSLTGAGGFTATLTGLTSGQTYYFKARATGIPSGTTVEGSVMSFTAGGGGGGLAVVSMAASSITTSSATINGTLSGLGTDTSAAVNFYWGTTNSPATPLTATPSTMNSSGSFVAYLTGLTSGQTYYFKARAVGTPSSSTVEGSVLSFVAQNITPDTGRLIGVYPTTVMATNPLPANTFTLGQFISSRNGGTVTYFKLNCTGSGSVKVAIYAADANGMPTVLVNQATQSVTAGWNTITFPATTLAAGQIYWLAGISDAAVIGLSGNYAYAPRFVGPPTTYASFTFPATYADSTYPQYQEPMFAGWSTP